MLSEVSLLNFVAAVWLKHLRWGAPSSLLSRFLLSSLTLGLSACPALGKQLVVPLPQLLLTSPPGEIQLGSTCIHPAPLSPPSMTSLIRLRACGSLPSVWVPQLSWGQHEGVRIFILAIWTVRRRRGELWAGRGKLRQEKASRQQSQGSMCYEISGMGSEHP